MKIIQSIDARNFFLAAILSAGLGLASSVFGQTVSYLIEPDGTAIQIGSLGGAGGTEASAINDNGQVVGRSWTTGSAYHAFITGPNGAGVTDLFGSSGNSSATGVNNAGEVVGWSEVRIHDPYHPITSPNDFYTLESAHAFITGPNGMGMTDLSPPGSSNYYTSASAINNAGQVVLTLRNILSHAPFPEADALITGPHGAGTTDIGRLGGNRNVGFFAQPNGINNPGQVVGESTTAENTDHAFITGSNGAGMTDLGTLGQREYSVAFGINDVGQVTGFSSFIYEEGPTHAFITGPNGIDMTDLGVLGGSESNSLAYGINDAGQVVGSSNTNEGTLHAFITGTNGAAK